MNKRNRPIVFISIVLAILMSIFFTVVNSRLQSNRTVEYDYFEDLETVKNNKKVLKIAGGSDFSPFSYLDENGNPMGHDIELIIAICKELGYRPEITLGDWTDMQNGILNGSYDVLLTVDYSDERSKTMGYTSPVCMDNYVFFGTDSSLEISDLQDLRGLRIASLKNGGATDNYLAPLELINNTKFYNTQIEAFESVVNGENDVAIAGYIYGSNIIASLNMDLMQIGNPLYGSAYYYTFNIKNEDLGPMINSALASLEAKGELDRIAKKWIVQYQPNLTLIEYIKQNITYFTIAILFLLLIILIVAQIVFSIFKKRETTLIEKNYLTGVLNLHSFLEQAEIIVKDNSKNKYAIGRIDIDNFKAFNNSQGRVTGDAVLKAIGDELNRNKKYTIDFSLYGYAGADNFLFLIDKKNFESDYSRIYACLCKILEKACPEYTLSIRLGLADVLDLKDGIGKYVDQASVALKNIKNDYYKHWTWFDASMQADSDKAVEISSKMYKALKEERFIPFFQPQYDYATGIITGAETVARWLDEDGSYIPPSIFVPVFENNGFIYELDKAIWRKSFECVKKWKEQGIMIPHISINISRSDIYHSDLVETLEKMINEFDIDIKEIHFEITESSYIENGELLIRTVNSLKKIGAFVEMDDFGTGYSSLESLKNIDVDAIKLDQTLISNNSLEGKDAVLIQTIVTMAKGLGLDLIAEGVEEPKQANFLMSIGCNIMQGYLFSRCIDATSFEDLLKSNAVVLEMNRICAL